jgi:hypothetical protein
MATEYERILMGKGIKGCPTCQTYRAQVGDLEPVEPIIKSIDPRDGLYEWTVLTSDSMLVVGREPDLELAEKSANDALHRPDPYALDGRHCPHHQPKSLPADYNDRWDEIVRRKQKALRNLEKW